MVLKQVGGISSVVDFVSADVVFVVVVSSSECDCSSTLLPVLLGFGVDFRFGDRGASGALAVGFCARLFLDAAHAASDIIDVAVVGHARAKIAGGV